MLRVGYQNVYHLYNKVPDLCIFLSQSTPNYNIFAITVTTRLLISDQDINIPNYCISRKDSIAIGQTGMAVYTQASGPWNFESDLVKRIWLELKPSTYAPNIYFLYRNPSASYEWIDNFVQMIDNVHTVKPSAYILVLGDFNIDLLKSHSSWDSTITLLGLTQPVKSPTRITQTSATLIDHNIYTNNPDLITEVSVPDLSISDHCPISCSRAIKLPKCEPKTHSYIYHFDLSNILIRLPFSMTCTGPRSLKSWILLIPIKPWWHGIMTISLLSIDMHL